MADHVRSPSPNPSSLCLFLCPMHLCHGWRQYRYITRYLFVFALACSLLFTLCLHLQFERTTNKPKVPLLGHDSHAYPPLHLFIPVNQPSLLFCKSLASAIINTYPPPILINFNTTYAKPKLAHGAKLAGMAEYLRNPRQLGPGTEKTTWETDLVLFADGFDIWYQLPSDVLIRRYTYFRTNVKGSGWTSKAPAPAPVIFGADKRCWPNKSNSPPCKLAPESCLPKDAYGADTTDKVIGKSSYKRFRPRYLNSGTVLGEWASMREVYVKAAKEAADRVRIGKEVLSDQGVLADVWGEDLERDELNRKRTGTDEGSVRDNVRSMGIVLDYESRLFQTMTHSHDDVKWNMVNTHPTAGDRDMDLSSDIYTAPLPPVLQLATNLVSNTIAALVHFNGPKFPLGSEKKPGWWGRMWWFNLFPEVTDIIGRGRVAKMFFEGRIERARGADAGVAGAGVGQVGGVWTDKGEWIEWEEICGKWDFVGTGGVWGI
ncbi:hypothetical protein BGX38DRAFT_1261934 [Terfezia claveryi]|nr:hypothetical protein BGX38DRAFT_1261934 [Terfezia claveryi]